MSKSSGHCTPRVFNAEFKVKVALAALREDKTLIDLCQQFELLLYHRSHEELVILSFPGPDQSIRLENFQAGRAVSRRYRNRRIGEFLKELEMTEGRSMVGEMSRQQIQAALGLKSEEHFRTAYLKPALIAKVIEMPLPDAPRSSKQRYRLTTLGRSWLEVHPAIKNPRTKKI